MFNLQDLVRENVKNIKPYSTARDEYKGLAEVCLDANENAFGSPLSDFYNRYPDPKQWKLKERLTQIKGVPSQNMILGNGSDEIIDLLFRAFCNPGQDNVILVPPTYGMYEVCAQINDVFCQKISLNGAFQLNLEGIAEAINEQTKMIILCSPNNPTGNSLDREDIETILANFSGLVVVDEAYINFSKKRSFIQELTEYSNLFVIQTLSKAWGLAGLRLGMGFGSEEIIEVLNKIKAPYNINQATQDLVLEALGQVDQVNAWIRQTVTERERLSEELMKLDFVNHVYPSDANFLLIKMNHARKAYDYLVTKGIIVRDRSSMPLLENCLRITVGTPEENEKLLTELTTFVRL